MSNSIRTNFQISRRDTRKSEGGYSDLGFTQEVVFLSRDDVELMVQALRVLPAGAARMLADELAARILGQFVEEVK